MPYSFQKENEKENEICDRIQAILEEISRLRKDGKDVGQDSEAYRNLEGALNALDQLQQESIKGHKSI